MDLQQPRSLFVFRLQASLSVLCGSKRLPSDRGCGQAPSACDGVTSICLLCMLGLLTFISQEFRVISHESVLPKLPRESDLQDHAL